MEQFKKGLLGDGDGSEALVAAEAAFVREASASVPSKTGWGYKLERQSLVGAMQAILAEQKKAQSAKLQTSQQMRTRHAPPTRTRTPSGGATRQSPCAARRPTPSR